MKSLAQLDKEMQKLYLKPRIRKQTVGWDYGKCKAIPFSKIKHPKKGKMHGEVK